MNRLGDIPVRVESTASAVPAGEDWGLRGGVVAVLHEIRALLHNLCETGEPGAVDLATMPLAPPDFERLREALGEGELDAAIHADGPSRVRETGVHGVWWIEHRDAQDNVLAEFIEVTQCPRILQTHEADLAVGLERLRAYLDDDQTDMSATFQHIDGEPRNGGEGR